MMLSTTKLLFSNHRPSFMLKVRKFSTFRLKCEILSAKNHYTTTTLIQSIFKEISTRRKRFVSNSFQIIKFYENQTNFQQVRHIMFTNRNNTAKSSKPKSESDKLDENQTKPLSNKIYTLPNVLCGLRIGITPLVGYLILINDFKMALSLCVLSSMTDFFDGWIARTFNVESKLGAVLDPLADKLLIATLTLTLTYVQMIPLWLTLLIFSRDFLIVLGGIYLRFFSLKSPITLRTFFDINTFQTERFEPTLLSKINTVFQLSLVLVTLASPICGNFFTDHSNLLSGLQLATGLTTFLSGLVYLKRLR